MQKKEPEPELEPEPEPELAQKELDTLTSAGARTALPSMRWIPTVPMGFRTLHGWRKPAALLLGPTGAGKSSFGKHAEAHGFCGRECDHFDFGEQLRSVVRQQTPPTGAAVALSSQQQATVRDVLERGALFTDDDTPMIRTILRNFMAQRGLVNNQRSVLLLNGLPRHSGQTALVADSIDIRWVVNLRLSSEDVAAVRTSGRHERADDTSDLVAKKLRVFRDRTLPLLEHYAAIGATIIPVTVDADTQPVDIQLAVENALR